MAPFQAKSQPAGVTPSPAETEWLVTNGLGGYASGTASGVPTRRYHGLLVAALPAPLGRIVMFNHLSERATLADGQTVELGGAEQRRADAPPPRPSALESFELEDGLPRWRYRIGETLLEKRVVLPHRQNTVQIQSGTARAPSRSGWSCDRRCTAVPAGSRLAHPWAARTP